MMRRAKLMRALSLAWCEMYLVIANLFRRFEVRIHNTTDEDMRWIDLLLLL